MEGMMKKPETDQMTYKINSEIEAICTYSKKKERNQYKIVMIEKNTVHELDANEYYLLSLCDGCRSIDNIIEEFREISKGDVNRRFLLDFFKEAEQAGILQIRHREKRNKGHYERQQALYTQLHHTKNKEDEVHILEEDEMEIPNFMVWLWEAKRPEVTLKVLTNIEDSLKTIIGKVQYILVILFPMAVAIVANNVDQLKDGYNTYVINDVPNLFGVLIVASVQASLSNITAGVISQSYNNPPSGVKLGLLFGFIPKIVVEFKYEYLSAKQRSEVFFSIVKVRMLILSIAIFIWHASHGYGTSLPFYSIIFMMTGFVGFMADALPLWPSPGYYGIINSLNRQDIIRKTIGIWLIIIKGTKIPKEISRKEINSALIIGFLGIIEAIISFTVIISFLSRGISDILVKSIFGDGAQWIISAVLWVFAGNVCVKFWTTINRSRQTDSNYIGK